MPATDTYSTHAPSLVSGAVGHEAITPSDSVDFTNVARAIYVGVTGDVAAVLDGVAVTYKAVPAGAYLYGRYTRVNSSNTDATDMVAVW